MDLHVVTGETAGDGRRARRVRCGLGGGRGAIRRTLRWRPLVFVGLVSYGIYLWHVPLITWMERQAGRASADTNFFVLTAATITAAILVATVSWYVVEKPIVSLSRRRRLLGRRPAAGA